MPKCEEDASATIPCDAVAGGTPTTLPNPAVECLLNFLKHAEHLKAADVAVLLDHGNISSDADSTRTPCLLLYHSAVFQEKHWLEIQDTEHDDQDDLSRPSRINVTRALCFTERLQILSGSYLATISCARHTRKPNMIRSDFVQDPTIQSQLGPFHPSLFPVSGPWESYPGTIIRVPLDQDPDISFTDMHTSLEDFMTDELNIALLFASHVSRIAIKVLRSDGTINKVASSSIKSHNADPSTVQAAFKSSARVNKMRIGDMKAQEEWNVIELAENLEDECARVISEEIGVDVRAWLEREGLTPRIRVAVPVTSPIEHGRLFDTFALPVSTPFPFHLDAPFSLAPNNHRLRDPEEVVESASLDELLIEWNKAIFSTFLPAAWVAVLESVAMQTTHPNLDNFIAFWPSIYDLNIEGSLYWKTIADTTLRRIVSSSATVWPAFSPDADFCLTFMALEKNTLVAPVGQYDDLLTIFTLCGIQIVLASADVSMVMEQDSLSRWLMSPDTVHKALLSKVDLLENFDSDDRGSVLAYLVQSGTLETIIGLPLVPCSNGDFLSPRAIIEAGNPPISTLCLTEQEFELFPNIVQDIYIIVDNLPSSFRRCDPSGVDLRPLQPEDIQMYIQTTLAGLSGLSADSERCVHAWVWSQTMWEWAIEWECGDALFDIVGGSCIFPAAHGSFCVPKDGLLYLPGTSFEAEAALFLYGVPVFLSSLSEEVSSFLRARGCLRALENIDWILEVMVASTKPVMGVEYMAELRRTLARAVHHVNLSTNQNRLLRSLPIFPIVTHNSTEAELGFIPEDSTIKLVRIDYYADNDLAPSVKATLCRLPLFILPEIRTITYVVDDGIAPQLVQALEPSLRTLNFQNLAQLAVEYFPQQPRELQKLILDQVQHRRVLFSAEFLQQLASSAFLTVGDNSLRAPARVFHPDSDFARTILHQNHHQYPRISEDLDREIIDILEDMGMLAVQSGPLDEPYTDEESDDGAALLTVPMAEKLTTRISNALRQYSIEQTITEFLANAIDAGARKLDILIDETTQYHLSRPESKEFPSAMTQLQAGAGLIIHNNAVFTMEDFEGIQRIGEGSKRWQVGKIGRFGLGALVAFHYTEVVMVVSGEYVLFLDPSKKYVSKSGNKTTRMMKIKHLRRSPMRYLERFHGLFGFSADHDVYPQTIFWLPFRNIEKAHASEISTTPIALVDALEQVRHYYEISQESTLFVPIEALSGQYREANSHIEELWAVKAERKHTKKAGVTHGRLIVHSSLRHADTWLTVSRALSKADFPAEFHPLFAKHLLPETLTVALAANQDSILSRSKLFCSLPLPITTQFPVHVHASFILADDRRSIRFDSGIPNGESEFNRWLLSEVVPNLYLSLLESWPGSLQETKLWPNPSECVDPLANTMALALYKALDASHARVCETVTNVRVPPSDAVLLRDVSPKVAKVLLMLFPPKLVQPPSAWRTVTFKSIPSIDPTFLREAISTPSTARFLSLWDLGKVAPSDVAALLQYFSIKDVLHLLVDLPLLPLANQTLGVFVTRTSHHRFYILRGRQSVAVDLFPKSTSLFVLGDMEGFDATALLGNGLNVDPLSDELIASLIKERISVYEEDLVLSKGDSQWTQTLWTHISKIDSGCLVSLIRDVPLVAAAGHDRVVHISLSRCRDGSVLLLPDNLPNRDTVAAALKHLGALIVKRASPPRLRDELSFMQFNLHTLLRFLSHKSAVELEEEFSGLVEDEWNTLAAYLRDVLFEADLSRQQRDLARLLPIWPGIESSAEDGQGQEALRSTASSYMLPAAIPLVVALPFLTSTVNYIGFHTTVLNVLDVKSLSWAQFREMLVFEQTLSRDDINLYLPLLRILVRHVSDNRPIPVPNTNGDMRYSDKLYCTFVDLFRMALETRPELFIHPSLRAEFEHPLYPFGTRAAVTFGTFKVCVQAIHDTPPGHVGLYSLIERATEAYRWYNDDAVLQKLIVADEVDNIRFIPRSLNRKRSPDFPLVEFVKELPEVVAPRESLLDAFEAVAWTQRALFREDLRPTDILLLRHKGLGVPKIDEVAEHLHVLANQVAPAHQFHTDVISDLRATYKYLMDHETNPGERHPLHKFRHEPLFLNVDDPSREWTFSSAFDILINAPEGGDLAPARRFLHPFENLLLRVGTKRLKPPTSSRVPGSSATSNSEQGVGGMSMQFIEMRRNNSFTDVVLIDNEGREHGAHRMVLACHGDHLKAMFLRENGMMEGRTDAHPGDPVKVDLSGMYSGACLESALDYFYTGQLSDEVQDVQVLADLLDLSDYWNVPHLQALTEMRMISHITPWTVDAFYDHADNHRAKTLMEACTEYKEVNAEILSTLEPPRSQVLTQVKRESQD